MDQIVIDSKQEPLPAPTVISTALEGRDLGRLTPAAALAGVAKELTMDSVDMLQVGNTVFIGHRGKGKNKDLMWGRAINVDTAQNFIANGLRYLTHLQKIGVKRYVTEYDGTALDSAFKMWKKYADRADTKIAVGRLSDGNSKAFITLGKIPLTEVM
tara:strand:+ start:74 stop:544 length:471 start_codon:yes stop_codon:yes gene_type:complete